MQIKSCDAFQNTDLSKLSYFCDEICGLNILRTKFMSQRQNKSIAAQNITAKSFIYDDLQARCKKLKNYFKTKKNVFDEGYNKLGDFNTFVRELNLLSTMYYSALNYLKKPFLKFYLRIKSNNNFEDLEDLLKLMNQTLEEADYATASIPHKFDFITDTKLYHYTLIYLNNKLSQFDIKTRLNNAISKCLMKFKNTKLKEHAAYLNFIDELKSYIDSIAKIDEALNFIILENLNSLESKITTIYKYNYTGLLVRKHLIKNHF
ncbi:hypothetical protein NCER_102311 [Vairimorpha ceranae BRL01]|uniref:Uncharacterized protein n=1 Tax=Vairimorpha ceranae (strain BRL01) TaxID=578460 RepID=C4VBT5_VAIC1|nr:hypothetical protein NCER_102311 [Vairimorpha ceranae BRL01]